MYKKGDKFVVEIDKVVVDEEEDVILYAIKGFNALVFDQYGLDKLSQMVNGVDTYSKNTGYAEGYAEGLIDGKKIGRERAIKRIIEKLTV